MEHMLKDVIKDAIAYDEKDLKEWEEFEPIVAGLKHHKQFGIFFTVGLVWRRIIMLFVAMFMDNYPIFQVLIFVGSSVFMLCFIGYQRPFISPKENRLELYNEFSILTVGILTMAHLGLIRDPEKDGVFTVKFSSSSVTNT